MKPKNTICLWFDKDALEAARFYAATLPDSKVTAVHNAPGDYPSGKEGDVLTPSLLRRSPRTIRIASSSSTSKIFCPICPQTYSMFEITFKRDAEFQRRNRVPGGPALLLNCALFTTRPIRWD